MRCRRDEGTGWSAVSGTPAGARAVAAETRPWAAETRPWAAETAPGAATERGEATALASAEEAPLKTQKHTR